MNRNSLGTPSDVYARDTRKESLSTFRNKLWEASASQSSPGTLDWLPTATRRAGGLSNSGSRAALPPSEWARMREAADPTGTCSDPTGSEDVQPDQSTLKASLEFEKSEKESKLKLALGGVKKDAQEVKKWIEELNKVMNDKAKRNDSSCRECVTQVDSLKSLLYNAPLKGTLIAQGNETRTFLKGLINAFNKDISQKIECAAQMSNRHVAQLEKAMGTLIAKVDHWIKKENERKSSCHSKLFYNSTCQNLLYREPTERVIKKELQVIPESHFTTLNDDGILVTDTSTRALLKDDDQEMQEIQVERYSVSDSKDTSQDSEASDPAWGMPSSRRRRRTMPLKKHRERRARYARTSIRKSTRKSKRLQGTEGSE